MHTILIVVILDYGTELVRKLFGALTLDLSHFRYVAFNIYEFSKNIV